MRGKPPGLYIHIPFCLRKCIYCGFNSRPFGSNEIGPYLKALRAEMERISSTLGGTVRTIYIGGGTPTSLSERELEFLLSSISDLFKAPEDGEFTIEANPGTLSPEKVKIMKDFGVNRISLGVQSFNDDELNFLGRLHSSKDSLSSYEMIVDSGISNVNLDLIFGIPGQGLSSWRMSLETALSLSPKHLSLYELTVEEGTLLQLWVDRGIVRTLEEDEIVAMYEMAWDLVEGRGYEHYEISNYAIPGYRSIHNQIYWRNEEYIGCGAGAVSFIGGRRKRNISDPISYVNAMMRDGDATEEEEKPSEIQAFQEAIMLGLRMLDVIDLLRLSERYGIGLDNIWEGIEGLASHGFLTYDGKVKLTKKGMLVSNRIIAEIMALTEG